MIPDTNFKKVFVFWRALLGSGRNYPGEPTNLCYMKKRFLNNVLVVTASNGLGA